MDTQAPVFSDEQAQAFQQRFEDMVWNLVETRGWSPRKARRFLESEARRGHRRMVRAGRRRQEKLRKEGKLVDTSDIRAQLDAELQAQLATKPFSVPAAPEYVAPTSEF